MHGSAILYWDTRFLCNMYFERRHALECNILHARKIEDYNTMGFLASFCI
jgi:hypothetical protein